MSGSISCEIVAQNFVRGVISQAHVLGNDWISFYSAVCGRRNSLQEGFFDTLRPPYVSYGGLLLSFPGVCHQKGPLLIA